MPIAWSSARRFHRAPGTLSNDFFTSLLDMSVQWRKSEEDASVYRAIERTTGDQRWTATPVDLLFGSHAELRAVVEVYAADDAEQAFIDDFVSAWSKVMTLDRFDL